MFSMFNEIVQGFISDFRAAQTAAEYKAVWNQYDFLVRRQFPSHRSFDIDILQQVYDKCLTTVEHKQGNSETQV